MDRFSPEVKLGSLGVIWGQVGTIRNFFPFFNFSSMIGVKMTPSDPNLIQMIIYPLKLIIKVCYCIEIIEKYILAGFPASTPTLHHLHHLLDPPGTYFLSPQNDRQSLGYNLGYLAASKKLS